MTYFDERFFESHVTTPELAWDCLLKYTSVELELLTDYEMYLFVF
jgi:hypothetical protein